jgi:hypothetical protein
LKGRELDEACKVQTPKETINNVLDLYFDSYKKINIDDADFAKLCRQLKGTMGKFENFVLFNTIGEKQNLEDKQ